jgi:hypothetical protein
MASVVWKKDPVAVVQGYEARHGGSSLGALVLWSTWAVASLHYLDDLDDAQAAYPESVRGQHPDIVDIAHVRWATGSAVTSLDLCAAALGRACCAHTKAHELDLRDFDAVTTSKRISRNRGMLPAQALSWIDAVLADSRYRDIQDARDPLTHSWLSRHLSRGGQGGHPGRTHFTLRKTNTSIGARDLVILSRDVATEHVQAFLNVLEVL